ncbi:hypothetical protein V1504DRAFT_435218 [Lipomyces starkeyi]
MPTVVFTTRALHAGLLLSFLRKIATERFGEEAASRIKGIWAGVQDDALVTPWIGTSACPSGVLSFREERQFPSRLRYTGRDDMAEYKFCCIPAGGADARRAGQRRLKLDILQTWDPEGAARWGDDFMSTIKSIWIPLKSELADSFNRHFWLHKTEFRLSQIKMVELDEQATIDELAEEGLATVDMVTQYTKEYTAGMSACITRFLLTFEEDYGDDLETLIDESVDLGVVGESHMKTVAGTIAGYVKDVRARKTSQRVLAAALTEDGSLLPVTAAKVRTTMKPYVDAVAFFDLACARRGNDGDDHRFWKPKYYAKLAN